MTEKHTQNQAGIWEGRWAVVLDHSRDWKRGVKYTMLFKSGMFHRCIQFVGNLTGCTLTCVSTYLNSCNWIRESMTDWAQHRWQIMGTCNWNYKSPHPLSDHVKIWRDFWGTQKLRQVFSSSGYCDDQVCPPFEIMCSFQIMPFVYKLDIFFNLILRYLQLKSLISYFQLSFSLILYLSHEAILWILLTLCIHSPFIFLSFRCCGSRCQPVFPGLSVSWFFPFEFPTPANLSPESLFLT